MAPVAVGHGGYFPHGCRPWTAAGYGVLPRQGDFTSPLALLAQWVGCDIAVTNPLPCAAIPALAGRIALVLVVMRRDDFLVFLAIAPGGQARAAG